EETVTAEAAERAAALVLAPRATQLPPSQEDAPDDPPPPEKPQETPEEGGDSEEDTSQEVRLPEELILEAARAAIPPDLLAKLAARGTLRRGANAAGAGDEQKGAARGRPAGHRPGDPRSGARLDLVATLRTAAPWQPLRRRMAAGETDRLLITPEDFRLRRYKQKTEKVVIFLVDASGSAALARLAETKGAVELMLAEAYVRREQVAVISFRGTTAELLLPPTRSLVQAKRRLSGLPGGGGTPLATGLETALALATQIKRRGQTPHLAVLTDGRGNIDRTGAPGREAAAEDALAAARAIQATGTPALVIDTGNRPAATARTLADAMGAAYLALPRADARALAGTLQSALDPAA
ncbi:MAG: VWA domain-containing protein, partial [Pseudomonadota bacterium]